MTTAWELAFTLQEMLLAELGFLSLLLLLKELRSLHLFIAVHPLSPVFLLPGDVSRLLAPDQRACSNAPHQKGEVQGTEVPCP